MNTNEIADLVRGLGNRRAFAVLATGDNSERDVADALVAALPGSELVHASDVDSDATSLDILAADRPQIIVATVTSDSSPRQKARLLQELDYVASNRHVDRVFKHHRETRVVLVHKLRAEAPGGRFDSNYNVSPQLLSRSYINVEI